MTKSSPLKHIKIFFAITLTYYIAGRLGLLFALPPSYATAIWPPSGIALAAILIYGYRCLPAIFLGSLLVNLQTYFDGQQGQLFFYFIINAIIIAIGESIQAIFSSILIRRFVKIPTTLEHVKDIVLLMTLGGPIACVVSASIGVTTLTLSEIISWQNYSFSWFAWWVGDTVGVLVFTPLLLLLFQDKTRISIRRKIAVTVPLIILFPVAIYIFISFSDFEKERQRLNFEKSAENTIIQLQNRLNDYVDDLRAIKHFYGSSDFVSRSEFREFVKYDFEHSQGFGIDVLGWIPAVSASQRSEYEKKARKDGLHNFQFTQLNEKGNLISAQNRQEYFPVFYLEPNPNNEPILGYDLGSEAVQLQAINKAKNSGETTMSLQINLTKNQNNDEIQSDILIYNPIYSGGRNSALKGFAFGIFDMGIILQPIINEFLTSQEIELKLYSISGNNKTLLYSNSKEKKLSSPIDLQWQKSFIFAGQNLQINLTQNRKYLLATESFESLEIWIILISGLLLTSLFGMLLLLITGRSDTIQKLVEEKTQALEESDRLKGAILASANHMIIATDKNGIVLTFNKGAEKELGYSAAEIENKKTPALWHDDAEIKKRAEELSKELGCLVQPGFEVFIKKTEFHNVDEHEWTLIRKNGSRFPANLAVTTLKDHRKNIVGYLGIVENITKRKQIETMKSEFISMVSHELRTPLTSIRGALGLIVGGVAGEVPEKAANLIRIANQNSERLANIIDDILNIEKLEAGKMKMELKPIDVESFLQQALESNRSYGDKYQVKFELAPVQKNIKVIADHDRLMQVMANLLSNAAKFSPPESKVIISATKHEEKLMRFSVQDFGTGIPQDFRPRIFEKFAQADNSSSKNRYGTGLGLNIARKMVEEMNGAISFKSEVGKGTTFFFDLPIA